MNCQSEAWARSSSRAACASAGRAPGAASAAGAAFWKAAPAALAAPGARPALAQAARELLLAQASDWQFMISTGAVPDYAERRFKLHCDDAERLVSALTAGSSDGVRLAAELERRDGLFPNVLEAVAEVLGA